MSLMGEIIYCRIWIIKPLNAELNPICHLLVLLGAHPILHISRIRVKLFLIFDYVLFLARHPPVGHGLAIHEVSISHTTTNHRR